MQNKCYNKIILLHRCCDSGYKQFNQFIEQQRESGVTFDHKIIYNTFQINELKIFEKYHIQPDDVIKYSWIVIPEQNKTIKLDNNE